MRKIIFILYYGWERLKVIRFNIVKLVVDVFVVFVCSVSLNNSGFGGIFVVGYFV